MLISRKSISNECVQASDAEVVACEQRIQEAKDEADNENAASACAQTQRVSLDSARSNSLRAECLAVCHLQFSVVVSGSPEAGVRGLPEANRNGVFAPRSKHNGWPRFENEHGCHLYYQTEQKEWQIGTAFEPDDSGALNLTIQRADGLLPIGTHAWTQFNLDRLFKGSIEDRADGRDEHRLTLNLVEPHLGVGSGPGPEPEVCPTPSTELSALCT